MMKAMIGLMKAMMTGMPVPWRIWNGLLITVNMLIPLYYIHTLEAKVVIGSVMVGVTIMTVIFKSRGFVRLLGLGHALWVPMVPWLWTRLQDISFDSTFGYWLVAVIVIDSLSLIIDVIEVLRYIRGERTPTIPHNA